MSRDERNNKAPNNIFPIKLNKNFFNMRNEKKVNVSVKRSTWKKEKEQKKKSAKFSESSLHSSHEKRYLFFLYRSSQTTESVILYVNEKFLRTHLLNSSHSSFLHLTVAYHHSFATYLPLLFSRLYGVYTFPLFIHKMWFITICLKEAKKKNMKS